MNKNLIVAAKMSGYCIAIAIAIAIVMSQATMSFAQAPTAIPPAEVPSAKAEGFKTSGTARLRYEDSQWYGSTGSPTSFSRTEFFSFRVRPKFEWQIEEGLMASVTPQFAKVLGRDYSYNQVTDSSGSVGYNENLHMHEAYLRWTLSSDWSLTAGRMILTYGDNFILAAAEWPLTGRAFDGFKLAYGDDFLKVDLLALKLDSSPNVSGSDRDLVGIYSKWNVLEELKALEIYGLYETNQQNSLNEARHLYGVRMVAELEKVFDAGAEWATQRGSSGFLVGNDYQSMLVATAGWTFQELYKLRFGLEYNQADRNWRDWYALLKAPLGRNEVVGRRNLKALAAKVSASPSEKLKVRLDYFIYQRYDDASSAYRPQDSIAVGTAAASASSDIGSAVDLAFNWKASDRVEYGVGASVFFSGEYLKQQFQDRTLTDFYAVTNVSF